VVLYRKERVRAGTTRLAAAQARRALSPAEAAEARRLGWESQRLARELAVLRTAFAEVRAAPG
jgi:hypothetical protein